MMELNEVKYVDSEEFGPPLYKFKKVHKISTNLIQIFEKITIE